MEDYMEPVVGELSASFAKLSVIVYMEWIFS
jgi:hypothetical protein